MSEFILELYSEEIPPNLQINARNDLQEKIKNSLEDTGKLKLFSEVMDNALGLTERKRSYTSDYGYGNVREVLLGEQDKLIPGPNWDKFYLENIIKWWKKKAGKRYEKMKKEGRFRTEVELWTEDQDCLFIHI